MAEQAYWDVIVSTPTEANSQATAAYANCSQLCPTYSAQQRKPMVSFVCKGVMYTYGAEKILACNFHADGGNVCPQCDQPLPQE